MPGLPNPLPISRIAPLDARIDVPGSKSLSNRALVAAALADGVSRLEGVLVAEDTEVMIGALHKLGIRCEQDGTTVAVHGAAGAVPAAGAELDLRLSGTSIRFLTALVALGHGTFRLDGTERMRERPIEDLVAALRGLGVNARSERGDGCPPVVVEADGIAGGTTTVRGDSSSQFLSGLLLAAPAADAPTVIEVVGELQSKPFADMTVALMDDFGVRVERDGYERFRVAPQGYRARPYAIEGDAMAAGYFWAAAAVAGGRVRVGNVGARSQQGDRRLADVLAEMGCEVAWGDTWCEVAGPSGRLRGGTFDLNDMPDQAQTLAVVALFADGPVRIENVWNLRIKETDRLSALARELAKFGVRVDEERDAITVHPKPDLRIDGTVAIDTYGDHRMAMAFALAGLRLDGVAIRDPGCVGKTYPGFFEDLAALGSSA